MLELARYCNFNGCVYMLAFYSDFLWNKEVLVNTVADIVTHVCRLVLSTYSR